MPPEPASAATPRPIPVDELPGSATASRYEGRDHGSTVSFFISRHPPGAAVPLHHHPYEETFIVQEGTSRFTVDGATIDCPAGHVVVVPAGALHGFESIGSGPLLQVSIHPSDHVIQEWVGET